MVKLVHIGNVYGDQERFKIAMDLAQQIEADVVAITGNLAGPTLSREEAQTFIEASRIVGGCIPQVRQLTQNQIRTFQDTAKFLIGPDVKAADEIKKAADVYLALEDEVERRINSQYQDF